MRIEKIACLLLVGVMAGGVVGQRKPDLPPSEQEGEPLPNQKVFAKAYRNAGEPRILVLCGVDNRLAQLALADVKYRLVEGKIVATFPATVVVTKRPKAEEGIKDAEKVIKSPKTATGSTAENGHVGQNISLFDPTGVAPKLKSDIEELILENKDVELVDMSSLAEADRREITLLAQRSERRAMNLLGAKVNADVVLAVRLLPIPRTVQLKDRARFRVTVDMVQPTRGRKIGGFAFDWRLGTDSLTIKRYGRQITRKFVEEFAAWYGSDKPREARYTVRVTGVSGVEEMVKVRRALESVKGVGSILERGFSADGKTSVAELRVGYTGSAIELVGNLKAEAAERYGLAIEGADATTGTIMITVGKPEIDREKTSKDKAPGAGATK